MIILLVIIPLVLTLYYGAIISGVYKDPLMARFRRYGPERRIYPLCRFLEAAGATAIVAGLLVGSVIGRYSYFGATFAPLSLYILALMSFLADITVRQHPNLREALPRWYFDLLRNATRQERRFIGFAWLRMPRKMRWRLNGDQAAFRSWADTVRITVIYGAYDPESPWSTWGS